MWDRPELLNRIANGLYALAGLAVAYGVAMDRRSHALVRAASHRGERQLDPRHARADRGHRRGRDAGHVLYAESAASAERFRETALGARGQAPPAVARSPRSERDRARAACALEQCRTRQYARRDLSRRVRRQSSDVHRTAWHVEGSGDPVPVLPAPACAARHAAGARAAHAAQSLASARRGRADDRAWARRHRDSSCALCRCARADVGHSEAPHRLRRSALRERLRGTDTRIEGLGCAAAAWCDPPESET